MESAIKIELGHIKGTLEKVLDSLDKMINQVDTLEKADIRRQTREEERAGERDVLLTLEPRVVKLEGEAAKPDEPIPLLQVMNHQHFKSMLWAIVIVVGLASGTLAGPDALAYLTGLPKAQPTASAHAPPPQLADGAAEAPGSTVP